MSQTKIREDTEGPGRALRWATKGPQESRIRNMGPVVEAPPAWSFSRFPGHEPEGQERPPWKADLRKKRGACVVQTPCIKPGCPSIRAPCNPHMLPLKKGQQPCIKRSRRPTSSEAGHRVRGIARPSRAAPQQLIFADAWMLG